MDCISYSRSELLKIQQNVQFTRKLKVLPLDTSKTISRDKLDKRGKRAGKNHNIYKYQHWDSTSSLNSINKDTESDDYQITTKNISVFFINAQFIKNKDILLVENIKNYP